MSWSPISLESLLRNHCRLLLHSLSFLDLISLYKIKTQVFSRRQWRDLVHEPSKCQSSDIDTCSALRYVVLIENDRRTLKNFQTKIVSLLTLQQEVECLFAPFDEIGLKLDMVYWQQKNVNLVTPQLMQKIMQSWRNAGLRVVDLQLPMCDQLGWCPASPSASASQSRGDSSMWIQCLKDHKPSLKSLQLSGCNVKDSMLMDDSRTPSTANGIASLSSLQQLSLAYNVWVTDMGVRHLNSLVQLEQLDLSFTKMTDVCCSELLQHLKQLRQLHLMGTGITDRGLSSLAKLEKLSKLNIMHCKINSLQFLSSLRSVEALCFSWSSALGTKGAGLQLIGTSLRKLKELVICGIDTLGSEQLGQILGDIETSELQTLSIRCQRLGMNVEKDTRRCLAMFASLPKLKHLDLHIDGVDFVEKGYIDDLRQLLDRESFAHLFLHSNTGSVAQGQPQCIDAVILRNIGELKSALSHLSIVIPGYTITAQCLGELLHRRQSLRELNLTVCAGNGNATEPNNTVPQLKSITIEQIFHSEDLHVLLENHGSVVEKLQVNDARGALTDANLGELVSCCPSLVELTLSGCSNITDQGMHALKSLSHLRFLSFKSVEHLTVKAVLPLGNALPNLRELELPETLQQYCQKLSTLFATAVVHI